MVSIAGGEPLLHPEIDEMVRQFVSRKIFVYLCANAVLLRRKMLVPTMRTLAENEKRSRSNAPPAQPQVAGGASGAKKKAAKKKAAKKK